MRMYLRHSLAALVVLSLTLTGSASASGSVETAGSTRSKVFAPGAAPYGQDLSAWTVTWWRWTMGAPYATNPNLDPTGANCGVNQTDSHAWFMATTFNAAPADRTCVVPGRHALVINLSGTLNDYPCPFPFEPPPGQSLEDFLAEGAKRAADSIDALSMTIDGVSIPDLFAYRAPTRLFTFTGDPSMKRVDPCVTGTSQYGVADGYTIVVKPLRRGTHQINISAHDLAGNTLTLRTTFIVTR